MHSDRTTSRPDTVVFIGDTLGQLPIYYLAADVAFVGGSLVPSGGHNMLEPAFLGRPVITGPHIDNFCDAGRQLQEAGACRLVTDAEQLSRCVLDWFRDAVAREEAGKRGREVVERNRGALRAVMGMIEEVLAC
jgi:3-deoxy-D-manno-octulosonic-acid transferase